MNRSHLRLLGFGLMAAWLLSGCANGYLLDNDVQAFSSLTALPAEPTYRFERLPSQQEPAQAQLESMAAAALQRAGLRRDDANPHYSVQVSGAIHRILSPWSSNWRYGAWGGPLRRHFGIGGTGLSGFDEPYWYRREVSVILRELPSNRVVFETHGVNDSPWVDDQAVFGAMFQAALQGFPTPPPGSRRVDVQVGAGQTLRYALG
jgi:hypothetical protein